MNTVDVANVATRPRALVVYESMFGNTRDVARSVAAGLAATMEVTAVEVGDAPATIDDSIDLLVIGAPTQAFGLSRPRTRDWAAQRTGSPLVSKREGIREWLGGLTPSSRRIDAAAFDTKFRCVPGSAAGAALRRLRRLNFNELGPAASFHVTGVKGPLVEGQLARARTWGRELGRVAAARLARAAR